LTLIAVNPTAQISTLKTAFLVVRCQAGDEDAFRQLFEAFKDDTIGYLTTVVGAADAWDVQQSSWMIVLRKIRELTNPKRFKPWLYRIVRNQAIDHLRRVQRADRMFDSMDGDEQMEGFADPLPLDDNVDRHAIRMAINRLRPAQQEVVFLRFWEQFSYAEIALITGVPVGTIRSRLFHAKTHLARILSTEIDPY